MHALFTHDFPKGLVLSVQDLINQVRRGRRGAESSEANDQCELRGLNDALPYLRRGLVSEFDCPLTYNLGAIDF